MAELLTSFRPVHVTRLAIIHRKMEIHTVINNVLVTGAAGFIGSHLCDRLASQGRNVTGLDNFDPFYSKHLKDANVESIRSAGVDFLKSDVRDYGDIASVVDVVKPDAIVHLAAKAGVRNSVRFPRQYFETNLLGTQNILDASRATGVPKLVLASTSSVYGDTSSSPFLESAPAVRPKHPYAASKRSGEILASTYADLYGLQITVTRLFTVYGPRGRPDMMTRLLLEHLTTGRPVTLFDGDLRRDWTYVNDIVQGLVAAVDATLGFEIINLGRGEPVSLREFIATIEQVSGLKTQLDRATLPASEMVSTFASIDKARDLLGFAPTTSVHEGIVRTWNWWEGHVSK